MVRTVQKRDAADVVCADRPAVNGGVELRPAQIGGCSRRFGRTGIMHRQDAVDVKQDRLPTME